MKYLKSFNENKLDSIFDNKTKKFVEDCIKDCLTEYCTEYGMRWTIDYGFWTELTHFIHPSLIRDRLMNHLRSNLMNMDTRNAIKIVLSNESTISETGRMGRLEIYLDDNSEELFRSSVRNLQDQLEFKLDVTKVESPEKLLKTYYEINIFIVL